MPLPRAILDLENRYVGTNGEPTLGSALHVAVGEWECGNRDRELRLHLLFLSWYCNIEPSHLTGYVETSGLDLSKIFREVFSSFGDDLLEDAEILFVVGLMATLTPWALGDVIEVWEDRGRAFRARYRRLLPAGLSPGLFAGRGAYGDYFAGQVVVPGGF